MDRIRAGYASCVLVGALALTDSLMAGGFDRFDQGIDLLFDPSKLVFDATFSYLVPDRKFDTVNGAPETVRVVPNIFRPSINLKFVPFEDAACLAAYRQPFGLDLEYGPTWSQARIVVLRSLRIEELGLTCSYRVRAGDGYLRVIGGATKDLLTYHEEARRPLPNGSVIRPTLDLEASANGWRAGIAYEVPDRAFRASLMYYSALDFSLQGQLQQLPLGGNAFLSAVPVHAGAPLPRAVEAVMHATIAPDWLNTVSVKWADWSVLTTVPVLLSADSGPLQAGRVLSRLNTYFRDGWTISNTVTHRWSDKLALSLRLVWDRGVSTGWTEHSDTWYAIGFANYKIDRHLELIGGIGVLILTAGEIDKLSQGGNFNATFGADTAVFSQFGIRARF
jgi:long-chain fatty acid transport protein